MNEEQIDILEQAAAILEDIAGTPRSSEVFDEDNEQEGSLKALDASELIEQVLKLRKKF